ncbi:MAG: 50S ribosomal protein L23 [Bacilli bacterium]|jgi:large subunit ribosomal protein L23|nr:50S ribosomal protein L23 [Bacilli bacterium]HOR52912.1 50S ribosomal protein L23 [Bacilli bacterium]HPL58825.1 50S ribosomal protein L23 [Bacilli bacterium]
MSIYDILIAPIITEKSTKLIEQNQYTFEVNKSATKTTVKKAVEQIFKVKVTQVKIINEEKKKRRVGQHQGFTPAVKKAIVTLAEGHHLDVFEV